MIPTFKWRQQLMVDRKTVMVPIICTIVDSWHTNKGHLIIRVHSKGKGVNRTDTGGARTFRGDFWKAATQTIGAK